MENVERVFQRLIKAINGINKPCDLILVLLPLKNSQFYGDCFHFLAPIDSVSICSRGEASERNPARHDDAVCPGAHHDQERVREHCAEDQHEAGRDQLEDRCRRHVSELPPSTAIRLGRFSAKKYLLDVPTLLMGVDVTHPSPTDTRSPSIASVRCGQSVLTVGYSVRCVADCDQHRPEPDALRGLCQDPEAPARVDRLPGGRGARPPRLLLHRVAHQARAHPGLPRRRCRRPVPGRACRFLWVGLQVE